MTPYDEDPDGFALVWAVLILAFAAFLGLLWLIL